MSEERPWFLFQEMGDEFIRNAVMRAFNDDLRGHYFLDTLAFDSVKGKWLIKLTKKVLPPHSIARGENPVPNKNKEI